MKLREALRTAILAQTPITNLLATYKSVPAVIARERLPADSPGGFPTPFVYISQYTGSAKRPSFRRKLWFITNLISVYGDQNADAKTCDTIAGLILTLFDQKPFSISVAGCKVVSIQCLQPQLAPDNDTVTVGRVLRLSYEIQETALTTL